MNDLVLCVVSLLFMERVAWKLGRLDVVLVIRAELIWIDRNFRLAKEGESK